MKQAKGFTLIEVIVVVVVLALVTGGAYVWYTKSGAQTGGQPTPSVTPTPATTPTPTPDPTASWQIYTNTAYGFSIKYPPSITYGEYDKGAEGTLVVFNTSDNLRTIEGGSGVFGISVQARKDASRPILGRTFFGETIRESEVTTYTLDGIDGEQWSRPNGPIATGVISGSTKYILTIQSSDLENEYRQMLQTFSITR